METETNKLLVSHNDLDGIAAVVIALLYGFDGDIYIAPNPQQIPEAELMKYDDITVTDLAPSDELMKSLISKGKTVRVYDHHSSAEHIRNYEGCILDVNRCGSRIYAELYENDNCVREFIRRVDLWDRFVHRDSDFRLGVELNDYFAAINRSLEQALFGYFENTRFTSFVSIILDKLKMPRFEYTKNEKILISIEQDYYKHDYNLTMKTLSKRVDSKGFNFAVCELPKSANSSLILNNIQKEQKLSYIIALIEVPPRASYQRISARAIDERVDLNKLKFLNGHPLAAGGQLSINFANKLLSGIINAIDYK